MPQTLAMLYQTLLSSLIKNRFNEAAAELIHFGDLWPD